MAKKYVYIKEEPISAAGPDGTTVRKGGFIPTKAEDIKVEQIDENGAKLNQEYYLSWVNQTGAEHKQWPDGRQGLIANMEDDTKKYWIMGQDGNVRQYKKYPGGGFFVEDWKRKIDRSFGITDEMWERKDKKIDLIHAFMFFVLVIVPAFAVVGSLAWWLHNAVN